MPCWDLLGVEICLPSLDDIVNAVVAPITSFVTSSLASLIETASTVWITLTNTISPLFQGIIDAITGFLEDSLGSITTVLDDVWGSVSGLLTSISEVMDGLLESVASLISDLSTSIGTGLDGLLESITGVLSDLGITLESVVSSAAEGLTGVIDTMGATLSTGLETAQDMMITAFDGMGEAISGTVGGIFAGFGQIDTDVFTQVIDGFAATLNSALTTLTTLYSPFSPQQAAASIPEYIRLVTIGTLSFDIACILAEVVSAGQIDFSLGQIFNIPQIAAINETAIELLAMEVREGVAPAYKRHILSKYQPNIPPYMDLISIYVKEGYLADHWVELPAEMAGNFQELGFSEYWTKRLWGKHWVYPSPTQLFDMLHRTAGTRPEIGVTAEVLRGMLKLHDFEPKWRGPLEAISWRTWRIYDTRTAWEMGIDDDETLFKRLVDQGYEPEDARLLAEVQKMFVLRSEIDGLTREADTDFIDGWISESQLRADYEATPYNPFVIDLRISKAKLRRDRELKKDLKAALTDRFKKGDVTEKEYTEELSRLGIVESQIAAELERARAWKLRRIYEDSTIEIKGLTEAKYSRAYRVGLITKPVYRTHLAALKYANGDIDLLVDLNTPEKPAPEEIKVLTVTELKSAYRVGILSEDEFRTELAARRYLDRDIDLIVEVERERVKVPTEKPTPEEMRALTVGQLRSAFAAMVLTSGETKGELTARRYGMADIETILQTTMAKWTEEKLRTAFRTEVITEAEFRKELEKREYPAPDIERIVADEIAERPR